MDTAFILVAGLVVGWLSTGGSKSQLVRALDVLVYGPVLIYIAYTVKDMPRYLKWILVFMGATTIAYNLRNFITERTKETK